MSTRERASLLTLGAGAALLLAGLALAAGPVGVMLGVAVLLLAVGVLLGLDDGEPAELVEAAPAIPEPDLEVVEGLVEHQQDLTPAARTPAAAYR